METTEKSTQINLLEKYEPIAIVGVSLRFPGHNNDLLTFGNLLSEGREGISSIPVNRWNNTLYYNEVRGTPGKNCTDQGGYIDDFDKFDAKFFSISPKEANNMDPQQRIMLELAWEALENANINPETLRGGSGSVYIGGSTIDFAKELVNVEDKALESHMATGSANSAISGRISYYLGLHGPSMTIDTACSSSLVALHLACNALRNKETDISLCGAVNLIHNPFSHIIFSKAGMLAPDGRCKTFDTKADGYGRSEGAAVLVLKRLSDARKDNNNIMALVRGTAVLQDGAISGGLTVPNGLAQEKLIRKTLKNAMCETKDISYIEAHGTGTPVGDPIEIQAINRIFSEYYNKENPLLVASVKTNIGHMEATAGMGGIIKIILQLQNNVIYPHLHLTQPSEHIPWDELAVEVPIKLQKWEAKNRRALINSFGFSGTIASAILEEVPKEIKLKAVSNDMSTPILTISAKNEAALGQLLEKYKHAIENLKENELLSFCHISNVGRAHFSYRYAALASDKSLIIKSLNQAINHFNSQGWEISKYKANQVVFLYTGQGAQYPGMGKALYQRYEIFRNSIDECDYLFKKYLNCSIKSIMFGEVDNAKSLLSQTFYTQPALFSIEYAVTQLWLSWGVKPSLLMGHSIGEIVAATIAKLFSLIDAVKLVFYRASLMQSVNEKGSMIAIQADYETVKNYLFGFNVSIAGVNSPSQCVISGDLDELDSICRNLANDAINFTRLKVSHAFHSAHMDQILDEFKDSINDVQFNQPLIPFISNLTGKIVNNNEVMSTDYWARHIRETVQFLSGVQTINEKGKYTFIEMGPRPDLISLGKQCLSQGNHLWISSLKPDIDDIKQITESLIKFYLSNGKLDWKKINVGIESCYFPLPLYAFDKKSYWLKTKKKTQTDHLCHPLLGKLTQSDNENWVFISTCSPNNPTFLGDHVISERVIFPVAGFVEMIIAMQDQVFGCTDFCIKDINIQEPLLLNPKVETKLKTTLKFETENSYYFEILAYSEDITTRHASGYLERVSNYSVKEELLKFFQEENEHPIAIYDNEMLYKKLWKKGFEYGEQFRNVLDVEKLNNNEVWARITNLNIDAMMFLSPTILDAVLQSIVILGESDKVYLPVGIGEFFFLKKPKNDLQSKVKLKKSEKGDSRYDLIADVILHDSQGPVFVARELRMKEATIKLKNEEILYSQSWKSAALRNSQNKLGTVIFIGNKRQFSSQVNDYLNFVLDNLIWANGIEQIRNFLLENHCQHIVYFWKKKDYEKCSTEKSMQHEAEINFKEILTLLKMLENEFFEKKVVLTFVTAGGQVLPEDNVNGKRQHYPIQSTLHGFNTALLNESPRYQNRIIDFDSLATEQLNNIRLLINELSQNNSDEHYQIAFRGNNRYVLGLDNPKLLQDNFVLDIADYGTFTNIQRKTIPIVEPKDDEILVKVEAAGLSFKDVLNVLGLLKEHAEKNQSPYKSLPLGFECSGTVIKVAENATFVEGDQVLLAYFGCMQRYITVSSKAAVKKPKNIRFDQAAAIPTAYITAYHALHNLAKIKKGDHILIHAGAGGVGQAAIQLAKRVGANIIASASHLKWDFLQEQGINHIINSRESTFSDKIKLLTDGKGVDIVLNSFNKNYIQEGFNALARHGRFIELGKIDIWTPEKASQYRPDVAYYNFDLSELPENELKELHKNILDTIVSYLEKGEIQPLPIKTFSLTQLEDAFSLLSKGENIGKVVVDVNECRTIQNTIPVSIQEDRTYLITGGYGALGQYAAKWLIEHGAKHIALIGRKRVTEAKLDQLKLFLDADVKLLPLQGDIAKREDVEQCFTIIRETSAPLGGIIHTAGILKDAPINIQTWGNFDEIFSSKVYGTWLLNEYAKNEKSKPFFVSYSSVISILGAPGQSNYSAANAFIDNLMILRSSHQEHGLAINWGPWSDVGMAAQLDIKKFISIEKKGLKFIEPYKAMKAFSEAIFSLKSQVLISQFNWTQFAENMIINNAYFKAVLPKVKKQTVEFEFSVEDIKKLPINEGILQINKLIRSILASVLHFDTKEEIEMDAHFSDLGLDSLTFIEFKNIMEKTLKIQLKFASVSDDLTISTLSSLILDQLLSIDNNNKSSNELYQEIN